MKKIYFICFSALFCALLAVACFAAEGAEATQEVNPVLVGIIVGAVGGLIAAGVTLFFMCRAMNTVRKEKNADGYAADGSFHLDECRDVFLFSRVTRVRVSSNNKRD